MRSIRDAYLRYASLRGWRWGALKVLVTAGLMFLVGDFHPFFAQVVLTVAVVDAYVKRPLRDGRPLGAVGLAPGRALPLTAWGFLLGAAMLSFGLGALWAAGWYRPGAFEGRWARFAVFVAVYLVVSVFEEFVFRGVVLRFLERHLGSLLALALSSLVFGLVHLGNPNATVVSTLALGAEAGLLLGAAFLAVRSLWLPIGIHWSWNLFEGPVFGTPVSGTDSDALWDGPLRGPELWTGGAFGPEGGAVMLALGLAVAGALLAVAARRGHLRPFSDARVRTATGPASRPA